MRHEELQQRLRVVLAQTGLTQTALAHRLAVSPTTLNGWLRGRHPAPGGLDVLARRIETALGLAPNSLEVR